MYGRPTPQGSGNGWSGWYKGIFFRSIRELSYMVYLDKNEHQWITAERIKIRYKNWDGVERTYCPDFLVDSMRLVEIKPTRLRSSKQVLLKENAARVYCDLNGFVYEIIDPDVLSEKEIASLRRNGTVKFTNRYEQLFQERYAADD